MVKLTDKPISFGVASWTVIHLTFAAQPYKSKNPAESGFSLKSEADR
ncbi:hypothetical protein RVW32_003099 [Citrobacter amalonaticus]|nr:hypothetical protein [Citrobacter amalonaticus]